jgi:hypothetical protein
VWNNFLTKFFSGHPGRIEFFFSAAKFFQHFFVRFQKKINFFSIPRKNLILSAQSQNFKVIEKKIPTYNFNCYTLVNFYLLVIFYGELLLKKAAIYGVNKDELLVWNLTKK